MPSPMNGRWPAQAQLAVPASIPVPMGGINAAAPLAAMAISDAVYLYNVHPSPKGVRVRDGYREWQIGEVGGLGDVLGEVRTIIPYGGSTSDGSDARMFCATPTGIFDVTSYGVGSEEVLTFGSSAGRAGWGSFANFQTAAGSFIAYCDEANGYHLYTASTDTWALVEGGASAGEINGADPHAFAQVLNWKNRLWFVQKNSAQAWFLPVGQVAGTVSSFGFGSKFPHGGALASIANWTMDGGAGVDDMFVAVSNAGDVALYQGTNPASADTFALRGYWNIGKVPPGRRFIYDMGGDLLILSTRGLASLLKLTRGTQSSVTPDFFVSFKVGPFISEDMTTKAGSDGWAIQLHPRRNTIIITVPTIGSEAPRQYAHYVPTGSWSIYRGPPMMSMGVWNGELYFGTADGRVCEHSGAKDNLKLDATFTDVEFSGCTAFTDMAVPGRNKRIGLVRPITVSAAHGTNVETQVRWDFDLGEISSLGGGSPTVGAAFDTALWDAAVWGGLDAVSFEYRGAEGLGQRCAIAFRGSASSETTLVAFDVTVEAGGML